MPATIKDLDALPNSVNFRYVYSTGVSGSKVTRILTLTREQVLELLAKMDAFAREEMVPSTSAAPTS